MIMAILPPFWLTAMTGQSSYPLKSENASPPGTCRVYLSWRGNGPVAHDGDHRCNDQNRRGYRSRLPDRAPRLQRQVRSASVQPVPVQCVCDRVLKLART